MRKNYCSFISITMWIIIVIYSFLILFFIQKQKTKLTVIKKTFLNKY
jgi:competence protein ComGC